MFCFFWSVFENRFLIGMKVSQKIMIHLLSVYAD